MRSKEYSQNDPLRHLVLNTAKRYFWLPFAVFAIALIAFWGTELLINDRSLEYVLKFSNIDYYFKNNSEWIFFPFVLMAVSVFCGKVMFSFLFSKNESAMHLLTGVSRAALFWSRYCFGLLSALIPSLIPFFALLLKGFSNVDQPIAFSKNTWLILAAFALLILCFYTVSAVAATVSGRSIEFFAVCLAIFFGPIGTILFIIAVLSRFVHGFEYSLLSDKMSQTDILDVANEYSEFCPLLNFSKIFEEYATSGFTVPDAPPLDQSYMASDLVWLSAVSLLFAAAAMLLFRHRRVEFCGKSNKFPVVTVLCGVVISLGVTSVILTWGSKLFALYAAISAALICLLIFVIFDGGFRRIHHGLKTAFPLAAAVLLLVLFAKADLFGYSSKMPSIDEIESVTIQYKGDSRGSFSVSQTMAYGFCSTHIDPENWPSLTTKEDIQKALDIHKLIIEDGSLIKDDGYADSYGDTAVNVFFSMTYKLRDGSELSRSYPVMKLSTLFATLSVDETEAFSQMRYERVKNLFMYGLSSADEADYKELLSDFWFYCTDSMLTEKTLLELTDDEKAELAAAMATDKKNATAEMRYHPDAECVGIIWPVGRMNEEFGSDEYVFDSRDPRICIYATDTNTLAWLKSKGAENAFEADPVITSVTVFHVDHYKHSFFEDHAIDRYFESQSISQAFEAGNYYDAKTITDPVEIRKIMQRARSQYFTDTGNSYALFRVKTKSGAEKTVIKFLCDADAS